MPNLLFVVAQHNEAVYNNYLYPSIQKLQCGIVRVVDSPDEKKNIFQKYNHGIQGLMQTGINESDIIVFCHEDVKILDPLFREKIEAVFAEKKHIGLLGIAGTKELSENCAWWTTDNKKNRGHLMQEMDNADVNHRVWNVGFFDDLVVIDGCIMITLGKFLLEGIRFDETFVHNDFYDLDLSLQFLSRGYGIAVADILVRHKSMGKGASAQTWMDSRIAFMKKWMDKGIKFPMTTDQFKLQKDDSIVEIEV
jgi:hypothetical protein